MNILSIQSHVAYGHVGNSAAVFPMQMHGIEINPYASELAQVVVWIGYLQWKRSGAAAAGE